MTAVPIASIVLPLVSPDFVDRTNALVVRGFLHRFAG
jgi:hypothetical protein